MTRRLLNRSIIRAAVDARMGTDVNGPSLIHVPEWIEGCIGIAEVTETPA